jgi:CheY-like chemotaxis protein
MLEEEKEPERPSIRVLVVDDSPYNLFVMGELIKSINPQVTVVNAINGKEAIDIMMTKENLRAPEQSPTNQDVPPNKSTFNLVFLDLHMPVLDGFQVFTHLL